MAGRFIISEMMGHSWQNILDFATKCRQADLPPVFALQWMPLKTAYHLPHNVNWPEFIDRALIDAIYCRMLMMLILWCQMASSKRRSTMVHWACHHAFMNDGSKGEFYLLPYFTHAIKGRISFSYNKADAEYNYRRRYLKIEKLAQKYAISICSIARTYKHNTHLERDASIFWAASEASIN